MQTTRIFLLALLLALWAGCDKTESIPTLDSDLEQNSETFASKKASEAADAEKLPKLLVLQGSKAGTYQWLIYGSALDQAETVGLRYAARKPGSTELIVGANDLLMKTEELRSLRARLVQNPANAALIGNLFEHAGPKKRGALSPEIAYSGSLAGLVVPLQVTLGVRGSAGCNYDFSLYVQPNGSTSLQQPKVASVQFVNDEQGEEASLAARVVVAHDPANEVQSVGLRFVDAQSTELARTLASAKAQDTEQTPRSVFVATTTLPADVLPKVAAVILALNSTKESKDTPPLEVQVPFADNLKERTRRPRIRRAPVLELGAEAENVGVVHVRVAPIDPAAPGYVEIRFLEPFANVKPEQGVYKLTDFQIPEKVVMEKEGDFYGKVAFSGNPSDAVFTLAATYFDAHGQQQGPTVTKTLSASKANTPKVKYVRIRETSGGEYRMTVQVTGPVSDPNSYVELSFLEPFEGPKPKQPRVQAFNLDASSKDRNTNQYQATISFEAKPNGQPYNVRAVLYDSKGMDLSSPLATSVRP